MIKRALLAITTTLLLSPFAQANSCRDLLREVTGGSQIIRTVAPKGWYESSAELPTAKIDSVYFEIAAYLGGRVILGGSDLTEILVGSGSKTASQEMNILIGTDKWNALQSKLKGQDTRPNAASEIRDLFGAHSKRVLGFNENAHRSVNVVVDIVTKTAQGVYFGTPKMTVNIGELNREISIYAENTSEGKSAADSNPYLMIPLKSDYLVEIEYGPKGRAARVYFRNSESRERFLSKTLSLPNENLIASDWHLGFTNRAMARVLGYNLIIATRGMKSGWTLSPRSRSLLAMWVREFNKNVDANSTRFLDQAGETFWELQGVSFSDFQATLDWILADPG